MFLCKGALAKKAFTKGGAMLNFTSWQAAELMVELKWIQLQGSVPWWLSSWVYGSKACWKCERILTEIRNDVLDEHLTSITATKLNLCFMVILSKSQYNCLAHAISVNPAPVLHPTSICDLVVLYVGTKPTAKGDHLQFGHLFRVARDLGASLAISATYARSSCRGQSDLLQLIDGWERSRWCLASCFAFLGRSEASDEGRHHYERLDKAIQGQPGQSDGWCMLIQLGTVHKTNAGPSTTTKSLLHANSSQFPICTCCTEYAEIHSCHWAALLADTDSSGFAFFLHHSRSTSIPQTCLKVWLWNTWHARTWLNRVVPVFPTVMQDHQTPMQSKHPALCLVILKQFRRAT